MPERIAGNESRMTSLAQIQNDVARHQSWLKSIICARVEDRNAADDILSEVIREAFSLGNRWSEVQFPGPWLYRVAIRKVFRHRRNVVRHKRLQERLEQQAGLIDPADSLTPLEFLINEERNEMVRESMQELGGKYQEVLRLKYIHGWNYADISFNLGINKHKVAHRLRRARERLRQILIRKLDDEHDIH